MKPLAHLCAAWRAAKVARAVTSDGNHPLLLLPSVPEAFALLDACVARGMAVRAVGQPLLVSEWRGAPPGWMITSPLSTWRAIHRAALLPVVLAVFQDQLVALDDSYVPVCIDDDTYRVSPIEAMVVVKYHPTVLQGLMVPTRLGIRGAYRMHLRHWRPPVPCPTRQSASMVLAETVRPLRDCTAPHWYARELFQLKREINHRRMLAQRLQELEALLMLYQLRHGRPAPLSLTVDDLRASRLNLLRQASARCTG